MKQRILGLVVLLALVGTDRANAGTFRIRNLDRTQVYATVLYWDTAVAAWHAKGYWGVQPGRELDISVPSTIAYVRMYYAGNGLSPIRPSGSYQQITYAMDANYSAFDLYESQTSSGDSLFALYRNGKKYSTSTRLDRLSGARRVDGWYRYPVGGTFTFTVGSYYRVGTQTFSFSHNSEGVKTERFNIPKGGTVIGFTYSYSSKRNASESWYKGDTWVSYVVTLKGSGPFAGRPSFKGTVTVSYIYR